MKMCREHGIRVRETPSPGSGVPLGTFRSPTQIGYLCPFSPSRVLREDEVIDPDE